MAKQVKTGGGLWRRAGVFITIDRPRSREAAALPDAKIPRFSRFNFVDFVWFRATTFKA